MLPPSKMPGDYSVSVLRACVSYHVCPYKRPLVCTGVILLDPGYDFFVRGRFKSSYYWSMLKFCMRIYIYKCNRNIQESRLIITVH